LIYGKLWVWESSLFLPCIFAISMGSYGMRT
jgi:hypothetical protein